MQFLLINSVKFTSSFSMHENAYNLCNTYFKNIYYKKSKQKIIIKKNMECGKNVLSLDFKSSAKLKTYEINWCPM